MRKVSGVVLLCIYYNVHDFHNCCFCSRIQHFCESRQLHHSLLSVPVLPILAPQKFGSILMAFLGMCKVEVSIKRMGFLLLNSTEFRKFFDKFQEN